MRTFLLSDKVGGVHKFFLLCLDTKTNSVAYVALSRATKLATLQVVSHKAKEYVISSMLA